MNTTPRAILRATAIAAAVLCYGQSHAQTNPAAAPAAEAPTEDEPILLNQFTVSAEKMGRFSSTEATSGTRVAADLFSSSQNISVITREAIEDTGAVRVLDAAKYVSGISESTIPNGLDRTTIRGFQTDGQTIDGFQSGGMINLDPIFIDRIEVVKGANSVLTPSGSPGGTINSVTRKPLMKNKDEVSASWGVYDGYRGEFDTNHFITLKNGDKVAFRTVGAASKNDDGWRHAKSHWVGAMPGVMYQTKAGTQVTVQGIFFVGRSTNDLGVPADPSCGSDNDAKRLSGLGRETSTSGDDFRFERREEVRAFVTTPLTETLSMRIAGRYSYGDSAFNQRLANPAASGGSFNPLTGYYVPGKAYSLDANGNLVEAVATPFNRNNVASSGQWMKYPGNSSADFQNDYAHKLDLSWMKLTSVAGVYYKYSKSVAYNYNPLGGLTYNYDDLGAWPTHPETTGIAKATVTYGGVDTSVDSIGITSSTTQQVYLTESASFWKEKVILNGSIAYDNFEQSVKGPGSKWFYGSNGNTAYYLPNNYEQDDETLKSYGIVVKPIEQIAAFYSYSELATNGGYAIGKNSSGVGGPADQIDPLNSSLLAKFGRSTEYGLRYQGLNRKVFVSLSHFKITQDNYSIPNPANLGITDQKLKQPDLLTDVYSKGWELETRLALTKQLSIIGNYSITKYRVQGTEAEFRGATPRAGALLANYTFDKGSSLSGLAIGFGVDYRGRTPGDNGSQATASYGTTSYFYTKKPSFYIGERTIFNMMVSYKFNEHLKAQLTVNNILDKDYIASSISRNAIYTGEGIAPNLRATYTF